MSSLHLKDSTAWQFAREEIDIREEMSVDAEWLADRVKTLQECADERERAEARDIPVVQQEGYEHSRYRSLAAITMAEAVLSRESEYALHFMQDPSLKKTLKTLSAELDGKLQGESAEWENIRSERRVEIEQVQDRDRDLGFSM